jgi:antitoxin MazE
MELKLQKWGNSYGIRIPSIFLKELNLKENDKISIEKVEDKIIISKSKKQKVSLKKLFADYKGKNPNKDFSWDDPVGKEIW